METVHEQGLECEGKAHALERIQQSPAGLDPCIVTSGPLKTLGLSKQKVSDCQNN